MLPMENDDEDRALNMECPQCGLHATAYISPANDITEQPKGFDVKQDHGLDHTFRCARCGLQAKLLG